MTISQILTQYQDQITWKPLDEVLTLNKGKVKATAAQLREMHQEGAPITIYAGHHDILTVTKDSVEASQINSRPSLIFKLLKDVNVFYSEKAFSHASNGYLSYYSEDSNVDLKFVYYYLLSKVPYFRTIAEQDPRFSNLKPKEAKETLIPLLPLEAQQKVVALLEQAQQESLELANSLEQAYLASKADFSSSLATVFNSVPATFKEYSLKDLFTITKGCALPKGNDSSLGDTPWISREDFSTDRKVLTKAGTLVAASEMKGAPVAENSFLVTTSGAIGEHALVQRTFFHKSDLLALTLKEEFKDKVALQYCYYFFFTLPQLLGVESSEAPQKLSAKQLGELKLSLPDLSQADALAQQEALVKTLVAKEDKLLKQAQDLTQAQEASSFQGALEVLAQTAVN